MTARKRVEKAAWFEAPELGFGVRVRYVPVPEMARMRERATIRQRDRSTGEMAERLDPEIFARELAGAILDWRGLTREIYEQMIPIDPAEYPEDIPCEMEFKLELLLEARWFPAFVLEMCTNLAAIQKKQLAADVKNS